MRYTLAVDPEPVDAQNAERVRAAERGRAIARLLLVARRVEAVSDAHLERDVTHQGHVVLTAVQAVRRLGRQAHLLGGGG